MTNLVRFSRALYLSIGLSLGFGCAAEDRPIEPIDPDPAAVERVADNLDRLRALEVFQVGELMVGEGESTAAAATELEAFAGTAEEACAAAEADPADCTDEAIAANLTALRALSVVEVGDLLRVEPANNPSCYSLPCPEDIDA